MKYITPILLLSMLCGCSVGMALSGKKEPNLSVIRPGASRGEVELQLGHPVKVSSDQMKTLAIYEYEMGNEPSAGRAIGHAGADCLSFGLWEIVGTPIEAIHGTKHQLTIIYDKDDKVLEVRP